MNKTSEKDEGLGSSRDWRKILIVVLLSITFVRGVIYASVFPLWQAPDEPTHYAYTEELAKRYFPATTTDRRYVRKSEISGRPPLYYLMGAPVVRLLSTKDYAVRAYALRLMSVALYVTLVFLTYRIASTVFPENTTVRWGAPMLVAFHPQAAHIFSSVNSDILGAVFFSVFLLLGAQSLKYGLSWIRGALLTATMVAGIFSRQLFLAAIPASAFLFPMLLFREPSAGRRWLVRRLALLGTLALALVTALGLFFFRAGASNYHLNAPKYVTAAATAYMNRQNFSAHLRFFWASFWGNFGWLEIPLSEGVYHGLNLALTMSLIGLCALVFFRFLLPRGRLARFQGFSLIFFFVSCSILFAATILTGIMNSRSAPQGRYMFPGLAALALLFVIGLQFLFEFLIRAPAFGLRRLSLMVSTADSAPGPEEDQHTAVLTIDPMILEQLWKYVNAFLPFAILLVVFWIDISAIFGKIIPYYYKTQSLSDPVFLAGLRNSKRALPIYQPGFFPVVFYLYYGLVVLLSYSLFKSTETVNGLPQRMMGAFSRLD